MTGQTDRLSTALAGRYRIVEHLGAGGMANVYLAEDLKHDRKVAVKVLKPDLAAVLGAERFVVEIKTTAALQHPHILPLFDSGTAGAAGHEFLFYVMPYIEGETLREKLDRETQLGIEEAVRITTEVADALDYAHRQGVIHRDIKPENILLHDGRPMVADFGIALAVSAAAGGRMTETGLSLGTPHYMSPEQATADKDITNRSDVYSLGSVLYEMLTGDPPHTGSSAQQIIMKIVTEDAKPVTKYRKAVPPHVAAATARSLEKLPADRFESAADFARALRTPSFTYASPGGGPVVRAPGTRRGPSSGWIVAAALAISTAWLAMRPERTGEGPSFTFDIETLGREVAHPVVTPDESIIYNRGRDIRVRAAGALESKLLHRHDEALGAMAISPDGQWIVFTGRGTRRGLYKMPADGGPVVSLFDSLASYPVWSDDGSIYFENRNVVVRMPEGGGAVDTVLRSHFHPQDALPDGRGLLLANGAGALIAMNLRTGDTVSVAPVGWSAGWSRTGHVVYSHDSGELFAVPFDLRAFAVTGPPQLVLDGAATGAPFDISNTGTLVYSAGAQAVRSLERVEFWWIPSDGPATRIPITPVDGHTDGEPSPDATRLAYIRDDRLHVFDLDLGTDREIAEAHHDPVWSPDGRWIAYRNDRQSAIMVIAADGSGEPRAMVNQPRTSPAQWLRDGTMIISSFQGDIWAVDDDPDTDTPPRELFVAAWQERSPQVSPDRRWIAYQSDEDGVSRGYVRSWPDLGDKMLVTGADTLSESRRTLFWTVDSRSLWYATAGGSIVAATIGGAGTVRIAERTIVARAPDALWQSRNPTENRVLAVRSAAAGDAPERASEPNRLVVVTNWFPELRQRMAESPGR